jgi:hypothetical protein
MLARSWPRARSDLGIVYYLKLLSARPLLRRVGTVSAGSAGSSRPPSTVGFFRHLPPENSPLPTGCSRTRASAASSAPQSEIYFYLALSYSGLGNEARANPWFEKFTDQTRRIRKPCINWVGSYLRLSSEKLDTAAVDPFPFARTQAELGEAQANAAAVVRARCRMPAKLPGG